MRRDVRHRCHPVCWGVMLVLANVWFSGTPAAFGDGSKNAPEKKGFNTGQAMEEPQVSEGLLGADLESGSSFGGFETGNGEIEP
ncbi:MAG TPA: hypothetical protein HPQ00_08925, partial [Magnetococcales bacterium]|nr:hypothetical protein [Magnetococcales bacterium]